jgi:hypothetical protein
MNDPGHQPAKEGTPAEEGIHVKDTVSARPPSWRPPPAHFVTAGEPAHRAAQRGADLANDAEQWIADHTGKGGVRPELAGLAFAVMAVAAELRALRLQRAAESRLLYGWDGP